MERVLLLSIQPKYTEDIFAGTKTVELRRTRPRVTPGDVVVVYASSPAKAIVGCFVVAELLEASPSRLWTRVKDTASLSKAAYDDYFSGKETGYGIRVTNPWRLSTPVSLETLRSRRPSFHPPQNYAYFAPDDDLLSDLTNGLRPGRDCSGEEVDGLGGLSVTGREEG